MTRKPLIVGLALLVIALTTSCIFIKTRPWNSSSERTRFMLKMASELIVPVPKNCIEKAHRRVNGREAGNQGIHLKGGPDGCARALASCGNCHLPARNSGEYRLTYGQSKIAIIRGTITGHDGENLLVLPPRAADDAADPSKRVKRIAFKSIHKSVRLGGDGAPRTWWDFEKFGRREKTAKRMLLISAAHGVACTNCHVRHGEFALTGEGRHYAKTRKVIKRVPLADFGR